MEKIFEWINKIEKRSSFKIERKPLSELEGWSFENNFFSLSHKSGQFFDVMGLKVESENKNWSQPIIFQPEIGILGLLVANFGETFKALVFAKIEPGNVNGVQLSPTVQATKSNYFGAHKGSSVHYAEYFLSSDQNTIADSIQSEQGSRFYKKYNRNVVVELEDTVEPINDYYKWLTFEEIAECSNYENLVNMDLRTVLSTLSTYGPKKRLHNNFSTSDIRSSLNHKMSNNKIRSKFVPLNLIDEWINLDGELKRSDENYFKIIGAKISLSGREVKQWEQPFVVPAENGIIFTAVAIEKNTIFVAYDFLAEPGLTTSVELGPLYQCSNNRIDKFPSTVLEILSEKKRTIVDKKMSEEGGRFFQEQNRILFFSNILTNTSHAQHTTHTM